MVRRLLIAVVTLGAILPLTVAAAHAWTPQPAHYGTVEVADQPVRAADGTVLRADVYFPSDPATGKAAAGPFPVLLQQTPYGKENISGASAIANTDINALVQRGFIVVISDVRGTGDSGGTWGLFDPVQGTDGATLVEWAAGLPHSDHRVGLFGESYMGINQFLTVAALPRGNPVKAMFPIIAGNDIYKDTVTQGGLLDTEFSSLYLGLVGGLNTVNPVRNPSSGTAGVEASHAGSLTGYDIPTVLQAETGGAQAFDGAYWAARSPRSVLADVVADHIPAYLVGGWHDLFQRGELLNYTGLQNLQAGRPVDAPMLPTQAASPRYQLLMGPWQHVTTGQGVDLTSLEVEWFDTWLYGADTPLAHTSTPLHLEDLQTGRYVDAAQWPLPSAAAVRFGFGSGTATVPFTGVTSPCDLQTGQWSGGFIALATGGNNPCEKDDATLGATGATFTTAPMATARTLAGPIDVTLTATTTTTDAEWVATVEEVPPGGDPIPLTSGALLGDMRATDPSRTWVGSNGLPLLPFHAYRGLQAITPGVATRFDIEVFPTFATVPKGWSLRVTVTGGDSPHIVPTPAQLPRLVGGVYTIDRAKSFANFPLS